MDVPGYKARPLQSSVLGSKASLVLVRILSPGPQPVAVVWLGDLVLMANLSSCQIC